jgi:hypothetical protein
MARGRLAAWPLGSLGVTDPQWPIAEGAVKVGGCDKEKEMYMVLGRESIKRIKMANGP